MKNQFLFLILCFSASTLFGQIDKYETKGNFMIKADGTLFLETSDADISILGSDRKDVFIEVFRKVKIKSNHEEKFSVVIKEDKGNIRLSEIISYNKKKKNNWVSYKDMDYRITIQAPHSTQLHIISEDGDIVMENMQGKLYTKIEDGDINIKACEFEHLEIYTEDGDVQMTGNITKLTEIYAEDGRVDLDQVSGKLKATLEDGNLNLHHGILRSIDISSTDGNVQLRTALTGDGDYKIVNQDGDIMMELLDGDATFTLKHQDGNVRTSGDFQIKEKRNNKMVVTTKNANNVKVSMSTQDGDITLKN